jgi:chemotaxis protein CheD
MQGRQAVMLSLFEGAPQTLHPGDVACGLRGDRYDTLLGSCIAVVLTDPRRTVGAMCHIVHTTTNTTAARDAAWGDVALDRMYGLLRQRGIAPQLCEAYVYGGGNMFPGLFGGDSHVGSNNARWTLAALAQDGVRVLHSDVGGSSYRKLTWTVGPDAPRAVSVAV